MSHNVGKRAAIENFSLTQSAVLLQQPHRSLTPQPVTSKKVGGNNKYGTSGATSTLSYQFNPQTNTIEEVNTMQQRIGGGRGGDTALPPRAHTSLDGPITAAAKKKSTTAMVLGIYPSSPSSNAAANTNANNNGSTNGTRCEVVAPWATTEVLTSTDKHTGLPTRNPLVSESHAAMLDRGDPQRFNYFYQKHMNKIDMAKSSQSSASKSGLSIAVASPSTAAIPLGGRGGGGSPPVVPLLPLLEMKDRKRQSSTVQRFGIVSGDPNSNTTNNDNSNKNNDSDLMRSLAAKYQKGPSKFFGEEDELRRQKAKVAMDAAKLKAEEELRREKEAVRATKDSSGYTKNAWKREGGSLNNNDKKKKDRHEEEDADAVTSTATTTDSSRAKALASSPLILPKHKPHKRLFPLSSVSHVMDKRTDFLRQLTEDELSLVAKASYASGEREKVLSTMLSPFGGRGGLLMPPTTTTGLSMMGGDGQSPQQQLLQQNSAAAANSPNGGGGGRSWLPRNGPRIVSNDFKEKLKDRRHFQSLPFAKSNAFVVSAEEEGGGQHHHYGDQNANLIPHAKRHFDSKFHPTQQSMNDDDDDDDDEWETDGGDVKSKSKMNKPPRQKSLSKRLIDDHAAMKLKMAKDKADAKAQLAKDLARQRHLFETEQTLRSAYKRRVDGGSLADVEDDTVTTMRGGKHTLRNHFKGNSKKSATGTHFVRPPTPIDEQRRKFTLGANRPHDTSHFEAAVAQHQFHHRRDDPTIANGTRAMVVGGPQWGEDISSPTRERGGDRNKDDKKSGGAVVADYSRYSLHDPRGEPIDQRSFNSQQYHSPTRNTKYQPPPQQQHSNSSSPPENGGRSDDKDKAKNNKTKNNNERKPLKSTSSSAPTTHHDGAPSSPSNSNSQRSSKKKRTLSPSTQKIIDDRVAAIAAEEADSLRYHKTLLSHVTQWDEWKKKTAGGA